jgi:hypothetical protein
MHSNGKNHPPITSRTGHGAASVIPHLNDVIRLEPSHLGEADDSAEGDDGTATDHPKTSSTGG